jgi:hypothetical protein
LLRIVAVGQGAYYVATGIWPLISRRAFERVTGPKADFWLVRMVGILVAVIGATLISAGTGRRITPETALLAVGSAGGLAGVDVFYSAQGRISPVYAVEAVAEFALIAPWALLSKGWRKS